MTETTMTDTIENFALSIPMNLEASLGKIEDADNMVIDESTPRTRTSLVHPASERVVISPLPYNSSSMDEQDDLPEITIGSDLISDLQDMEVQKPTTRPLFQFVFEPIPFDTNDDDDDDFSVTSDDVDSIPPEDLTQLENPDSFWEENMNTQPPARSKSPCQVSVASTCGGASTSDLGFRL